MDKIPHGGKNSSQVRDPMMATDMNAGCEREESLREKAMRHLRGAAKEMEVLSREIRSLREKVYLVEGLIRLRDGGSVGTCAPADGGYSSPWELNRLADQIEKDIRIEDLRKTTQPQAQAF